MYPTFTEFRTSLSLGISLILGLVNDDFFVCYVALNGRMTANYE